MRKLLFIALALTLLAATACYSATITFQWDYDAASEAELGAAGGFKLFQSKTSQSYGTTPVLTVGPSARGGTVTVPSGTYFWVVVAFDSEGNESEKSNEVTKRVLPNKPNNLKIP